METTSKKTPNETSQEDIAVLYKACLEVIANALGHTWEELKALLQEEERLEKLRKEKMTLCRIEWREEKVWELTRTDTEAACNITEKDFASLYLCDKLVHMLRRRKTWIGYMPESAFDAPCWKQSD
jgi:hypothetical protein